MGKYKGKTLAEVVHTDWQWVKRASQNIAYYFAFFDIDAIIDERLKYIKELNIEPKHPNDILTFGQYKGKSIKYIAENNMDYLRWAFMNVDGFFFDLKELQ